MTSKSPVRTAEDVDEQALSYAEIKALAAGDPEIKEKMDLDVAVSKLKLLKSSFLSQKFQLEDRLMHHFPKEIRFFEGRIAGLEADLAFLSDQPAGDKEHFPGLVLRGQHYTDKEEAGSALLDICKQISTVDPVPIGTYRGFQLELYFEPFTKEFRLNLCRELRYPVTLGQDARGNFTRMDNAWKAIPTQLKNAKAQLANLKTQQADAEIQSKMAFPQEEELREKQTRLAELNAKLNLDAHEVVLVEDGEEVEEKPMKKTERER
jgi:hypothetical protein